MSSANFKLKRTAAASRGFLATARFSCNGFGFNQTAIVLRYSAHIKFYHIKLLKPLKFKTENITHKHNVTLIVSS